MEDLRGHMEELERYDDYYRRRWIDLDALRCQMALVGKSLAEYYRSHGMDVGDMVRDIRLVSGGVVLHVDESGYFGVVKSVEG